MSSSRSFFNACLGLTIVLPLFFIDLAALDFFGRSSATVAANPNAPDIRANLQSTNMPPPESQMTPASGQHLLLDLEGGTFEKLDDEEYLRNAILTIIKQAQMSLLGIQSAKLNPQGVSVVAMLAESHLSIHTWPEHGSALVDLFTCGDGSKLHYLLDNVVDHFTGNLTLSTYSIVPRGTFEERHHVNRDIQFHPLEIMAVHKYKNKVYEVKSDYQLISVYDHHDTMEDDFERDTTRSLFLDGELQSNVDDEEKYHESLVHPAFMASSTPPKRVLIIGGGIGGALRESLKYKSVEHVDMVDIDPKVVEVSREYLPSYSNCTGFGTSSCFDDPRAEVFIEDYLKWFREKMGDDICETREAKSSSLYDVIILDMVDPEFLPEGKEWAEYVYTEEFFQHMACALTDEGVLASNFGSAPEAPFRVSRGHQTNLFYEERAEMFYDKIEKIRHLSHHFQHTRVYDAAVPAFRASWAYALGIGPRHTGKVTNGVLQGLKDFEGTPDFINRKLKDRLLPTAPLAIYSGSIHHGFQYPTGDWKGVYCNKHPEACEDPIKLYKGMDKAERSVWHPVTDTVRAEIATIA